MKFIADMMLGKLAKWLKILGYDTLYYNNISDDRLIDILRKEQRVLLTRDTRLMERLKPHEGFFIEDNFPMNQLKEVVEKLNLTISQENILSRCTICNVELETFPKENAFDKVPEYVYKTQKHFTLCKKCNRIYWAATHRERIMEKIKKLLSI